MGYVYRMLPPISFGQQTAYMPDGSTPNGNSRVYIGQPGEVFDVEDADAGRLSANGWIRFALSGPTTARPAYGDPLLTPGRIFVDTTLGKVVVYDGETWRDPMTGAEA